MMKHLIGFLMLLAAYLFLGYLSFGMTGLKIWSEVAVLGILGVGGFILLTS